jgi:hypothetical protein
MHAVASNAGLINAEAINAEAVTRGERPIPAILCTALRYLLCRARPTASDRRAMATRGRRDKRIPQQERAPGPE